MTTSTTPVLEADGLRFAFGTGDLVVSDVSLTVAEGEFVALVGPNGSGKSTLLRLLMGLLEPAAGTVRLFGEPPRRLGRRWRLGYVPQRPALARDVPATVREVVAAGRLARRSWWRPSSAADRHEVQHAME
ncbi:MAG TPA: ATP-binding cassette domain-containing protein, partial [Acidimicrobiales bacterium]|nr:ATP-binding cassette domain-containing protein [Acidimicrobiales bacterium]